MTMTEDAQQEPDADEIAEQDELIARRCALMLEIAREALELDRRKSSQRRRDQRNAHTTRL